MQILINNVEDRLNTSLYEIPFETGLSNGILNSDQILQQLYSVENKLNMVRMNGLECLLEQYNNDHKYVRERVLSYLKDTDEHVLQQVHTVKSARNTLMMTKYTGIAIMTLGTVAVFLIGGGLFSMMLVAGGGGLMYALTKNSSTLMDKVYRRITVICNEYVGVNQRLKEFEEKYKNEIAGIYDNEIPSVPKLDLSNFDHNS